MKASFTITVGNECIFSNTEFPVNITSKWLLKSLDIFCSNLYP